jgi:hypothetical protein
LLVTGRRCWSLVVLTIAGCPLAVLVSVPAFSLAGRMAKVDPDQAVALRRLFRWPSWHCPQGRS